jgi:DNA (cytosine-5)-methyltransferase 1
VKHKASPRKFCRTQELTVTDMFCGAGGASIGMVAAGAVIREAANHWRRAVETYATNHQEVRVRCADISQTDPSRFETTDILWASPECKTHSQAAPKTRKPELFDGTSDAYVERSRVTMWDVVQFAEYHRYKAIIVENVVDIGRWALLDPWFAAMRALGYDWRVVSLNSMVAHPTPQSRDRWYVVFWQGIPAPDLEIRPACWCGTCEATVEGIQTWKRPDARWGKYRSQYTYTCCTCHAQVLPWVWPAASAIDWSLPCERIGDRSRPLAPATRRRIEVGLERYGPGAIVQGAGHCFERKGYYRTWPAWQPLKTLSSTNQYGVAMPAFLMDTTNTGHDPKYDGSRLRDPREPLFTQTALAAAGLVTGMYGRSGPGAPVDGPLPTLMGTAHHGLVTPLHHGETGPPARPPSDPFGTQRGRQETGLLIMNTGSIEEAHYRAFDAGRDPLQTVVGSSINQSLVVPNRTHGQARPPGAPLPTMDTSTGGGAFIAELRGGWSDASPVTDPLATFAASGNHHMLVEPFLTPYYGNSTPSPVSAPSPTVTSVDRCGLVEPSIEVDDCGFRMLEPPEAGLGMGFPNTYIVGGSKRDQVRQYGQAVTPPASCVLLERVFEAMS